MPSLTIRVSQDLAQKIRKLANKRGKEVSSFIRECLEQQLWPTSIIHKNRVSEKSKEEVAREKLMFKASLEVLLISRSLLSSIDDGKVQPIIDKANELTKHYYNN